MDKTYFLIYKITNSINGKIYVGCHRTKDPHDDYMGSGTLLAKAYEKHGQENFIKEILYVFDNPEDMFRAEAFFVNKEFLRRKDVYNMTTGGNGSWYSMNNNTEARKEKNKRAAIAMNAKIWSDLSFVERKKKENTERLKRAHAEGKIKAPDWTGRTHRQETKDKIGKANAIHQTGEGNSQFGKVWIFNEEEKKSIKILKDDLEVWLKKGWKKGRKINLKQSC